MNERIGQGERIKLDVILTTGDFLAAFTPILLADYETERYQITQPAVVV